MYYETAPDHEEKKAFVVSLAAKRLNLFKDKNDLGNIF